MSTTLNIRKIMTQVKHLNKEEQYTLLECLIALVRKTDDTHQNQKLSSISGVGSEIWKNVNIDEYIDHERQW
jgi:hypothetical protein